jgi:hypothetical protein
MRIRTEEQIVWAMRRNSTDDDPSGIKHELGALRRRLAALQLECTKDRARITLAAPEPLIPAEVWALGIVLIGFVSIAGFLITY